MPNRRKTKQTTLVPKHNLRNQHLDPIDPPIPPEPDLPNIPSPLDFNPFNALDDSDSGTDELINITQPPLSSFSDPSPKYFPPPTNRELSTKFDNPFNVGEYISS